ncbi:MAG: MFS transporter [Chloroflexi bacterium]|nr:MFS transporter [Chloroflexota bacterium]MBI4506270.1 MFS transporter [Chloroflexota bacterium]
MAPSRMNRLGLALLSLGHLTVDLNPGALPALLPVLFVDLQLSYTTAAVVVTVANLTSSVIQPVFGWIADRVSHRWLLPLGCFVSSAGFALATQAPSYGVLLALIVCSSLGVAVYHPEAARAANAFAGARKASGMALFVVGGSFGYALGPVVLGALLAAYGRPGAVGFLAMAVLVPPLLAIALPRLSQAPARAPRRAKTGGAAPATGSRRVMALLVAVIVFRQSAHMGLATFIPLYFVNHLGQPPTVATQLLAALLFGGVVGTLAGGPVADRWGRKPVLTGTLFLSVPLLFLFLGSSGAVALAVLFVAGAIMVGTFSVTVVMGQELMPERTALAAGLTVGLSVGMAGIVAALLGRVADTLGIAQTMLLITLLPLPGALLSLALPDTLRRAPRLAAAGR